MFAAQLQEIRKTNMARIACDNAEGIKFIQPHALFNIAHGNEHVPCSHVPKADLTKWKDPTCDKYYKVEQLDDHHKEELYKYLTREQTIQEIPGAVVYTKVPEIYRSYSQVLNPGYVSINRFTKTYTTQ